MLSSITRDRPKNSATQKAPNRSSGSFSVHRNAHNFHPPNARISQEKSRPSIQPVPSKFSQFRRYPNPRFAFKHLNFAPPHHGAHAQDSPKKSKHREGPALRAILIRNFSGVGGTTERTEIDHSGEMNCDECDRTGVSILKLKQNKRNYSKRRSDKGGVGAIGEYLTLHKHW